MPRPHNPVDMSVAPELAQLSTELRELKDDAGKTYRELAATARYSHSRLSTAASGKELPSWELTKAFVMACGVRAGEEIEAWRQRWTAAAEAADAAKQLKGAKQTSGGASSRAEGQPTRTSAGALTINGGDQNVQLGSVPASRSFDSTSKFLSDVRAALNAGSKRRMRSLSSEAGMTVSTALSTLNSTPLPPWGPLQQLMASAQMNPSDVHRFKARWDRLCIQEHETGRGLELEGGRLHAPRGMMFLEFVTRTTRSSEATRRLMMLLLAVTLSFVAAAGVVTYALVSSGEGNALKLLVSSTATGAAVWTRQLVRRNRE